MNERADLDRWILLRLDETVVAVTAELERYSIVAAARALQALVDDLTDWYVRRSRSRFWAASAGAASDKESAYQTLYEVLTTTARLLAPFTPFVAEAMHEILDRSQDEGARASVHLERWPEACATATGDESDARRRLDEMALIQRIVNLGHAARNLHELKTRQPLAAATLVASDPTAARAAVARLSELALDELNVKVLGFAQKRGEFVRHEVKPNFRILGKRLGKRMPQVKAALEAADGDALAASLESDGIVFLEIDGEPVTLTAEEVEIRLVEHEGLATAGDQELLVVLDTHLTPELVAEGRAREIVNRIQGARKEANLDYADRIAFRFRAHPELESAIAGWRDWISGETLISDWQFAGGDETELVATEIDGYSFEFAIARAG